jgi:translation initiation factor IF-3
MDYGKFKYEKSKKDKEAKKKQHIVHLKEIKLRPKTGEHDYLYKKEHARTFLIKGDRVKATVMFRGREITHKEFGEQVLEQLAKDLEDIAAIEISQKSEGRNMISIFVPDKEKIRLYKRKVEQEEKRLAKELAAQEQANQEQAGVKEATPPQP